MDVKLFNQVVKEADKRKTDSNTIWYSTLIPVFITFSMSIRLAKHEIYHQPLVAAVALIVNIAMIVIYIMFRRKILSKKAKRMEGYIFLLGETQAQELDDAAEKIFRKMR